MCAKHEPQLAQQKRDSKITMMIQKHTYLLEFRTTEPPSIKRIPELLAFCKATERDSSYVVPPTMNMTTSYGLLKDEVFVYQAILSKAFSKSLFEGYNFHFKGYGYLKYKLTFNPTIVCPCLKSLYCRM